MYSSKHWNVSPIHVHWILVFTVPVDALASKVPGHTQTMLVTQLVSVSVVHAFRQKLYFLMSCPMRGQAIYINRADQLTECSTKVSVSTHIPIDVCFYFMIMNIIFTESVDVLAPWGLGHPQTHSWSPNWILFGQGFSVHMYSDTYCSSYFMYVNVILTVPVEVLAT